MPVYLLILNIIQILARWTVAVQSFRLAKQKKMNNFYWLSGYFFLMGIVDFVITTFGNFNIGALMNDAASAATLGFVLRKSIYMFGDICLVVFIQKTFYQNRKSPYPFFLGLSIVWGSLMTGLYFLPKPIIIPSDFVTFLWFAFAAYQAYLIIAKDRLVEDWVKTRYLLIIIGNILMCSAAVDTLVSFVTTGKIGPFAPITNIALISGVVLFYLGWIMPDAFLRFLNRNYKAPENSLDMSEEEIMKKLGQSEG
jgi:hypothetical protein